MTSADVLKVLKFIALVLWTVLRICLILFLAIVLGGFRGAAKSKPPTAGGGSS